MSRKVRFLVPVNPDDLRGTAQAIYEAIQRAKAGGDGVEPKQRTMGEGRDWTEERKTQLDQGEIPGGFAGPNKTYPIGSADDVRDNWALAELADDPDTVRYHIKAIAKRCGWAHALPANA